MSSHVRFSLTYRALSDSALVSCRDEGVSDALGTALGDIERARLDHDTTVETATVTSGDAFQKMFLAAQVIGVESRNRLGFVDDVLPPRLHQTLLALVHNGEDDLPFTRRAETEVPLTELLAFRPRECAVTRPMHEVKAVQAALDDLIVMAEKFRLLHVDVDASVGDALRALNDEVSDAHGLAVPQAATHAAAALAGAPAEVKDLAIPVAEAVLDLASTESWQDSARIFRETRHEILRRRGH